MAAHDPEHPAGAPDPERSGLAPSLRAWADAAPVMLWATGPDGHCTFLSKVWRDLTGRDAAEESAADWTQTLHPEDSATCRAAYCKALEAKASYEAEFRVRRQDGEYRWVVSRGAPHYSPSGEFLGYAGAAMDITDLRFAQDKLEARQREIEAMLGLAEVAATTITPADLHQGIADLLVRTSWGSRCAVLMCDGSGVMRFTAWRGLSEGYRRAVEGHSPWRRDEKDPQLVEIEDVSLAPALSDRLRTVLREEGIGSLVFVPLRGEDGPIGKLMVYADLPRRLSATEREILTAFADQVVVTTGRLHTQHEAARLRGTNTLIVEASLDAVVSMNAGGLVTAWNPQAERTFGYSAWEAIGRPLDELIIPPAHREAHTRGLRHYMATGHGPLLGRRVEVTAIDKSGREFPVELSINPIHFGGEVAFSGFLRDISERRAAEEQLKAARAQAEAASRVKSEFLANMSHEIRTPMTAIMGFIELLREDGNLENAPQRRLEVIQTITRNGEHLLTLINDILDVTKIEAGKMTVERIDTDPASIVEDVISLLRVRATGKKLRLEHSYQSPIPHSFPCDPVRLRQILTNLVGNAIKFTDAGGVTVAVRFDPSSPAGPALCVDVRDTGIGMGPDQLARLFEPFEQADSSMSRRFGGSGLGLSISRRLAQLLGGDIAAASTPGEGSTFTVTIATGPVAPANLHQPEHLPPTHAAIPAPALAPGALAGKRILVAEDGPDNQRLITFHLQRAGAAVTVADNGKKALDAALDAPAPFDLIFMDMQMPEMDGYAAARALKARACTTPIIALTAHAMAGDREKCTAAGCDDYVSKPIEKASLLAACEKWLTGHPPRASRAA